MEKLESLMCYDGLYYIGDLIEFVLPMKAELVDNGDGWVDAQTALLLLNELGV